MLFTLSRPGMGTPGRRRGSLIGGLVSLRWCC